MAFGFLKKLVQKITGKGPSAPKGGKGAPNGGAKKDGNGNGGGRGRRGKRGRHGKDGGQRPSGQQQRPSGQQQQRQAGQQQQRPSGQQQRQAGQQQRQAGQQQRPSGQQQQRSRRDRDRGDRRRDGSRRGPKSVNTAANEMRPGGVVSPEEMAARKAAHAAWDPASFAVEPVEGKMRFQDFDLPSEVMHGIADLGFQYCTEIQALSLQNALDGKNIAGKAQTGSGKTAAFLVAILTRYLRTPESRAKTGGTPRALVIAPTRELVIQICKDADAIGKYCGLRSLAVYGGMDMDRQREELQEAPVDLLVATPGRLLDFCQRHVVNLQSVDTLVIDEADRMLDMGFIPDVRRIMSHLPPKNKRATMLYSATLTDDVMRLAAQWMEEPVKAEVESEHNATDTVRQVVYVIRAEDKFKVLFNHIALHPDARAIVFCNRKSTTEDVYESLKRRGVKCEMLSGDVSQNKRLQVLENFRAGKIKIVVATDVAGRGIHVDDIEYVINFDFPYEAEDYVHRIGRTGRAGNTGIAISFADEDESFAIPEIEEYINEPLKCTIIQDDDPLLKPLEKLARGQTSTLKPVDEAAKAAVDAREAVTEEQKAAAAAMVGGLAVKTAAGKTGFVRDDAIVRKEPNLENALDPKPVADEADAYVKPVEQKARLEEWVPPAGTPPAGAAALAAADEPQKTIEGSDGPVRQNGEQAKQEQPTTEG
jgi:ATP-dependent RNA helicase RhlB